LTTWLGAAAGRGKRLWLIGAAMVSVVLGVQPTVVSASGGYAGSLKCQHPEIPVYASTDCLDGSLTGVQILLSADILAGSLNAPANAIRRDFVRDFSGSPCTKFVESGFYEDGYFGDDYFYGDAVSNGSGDGTISATSFDVSIGTQYTYQTVWEGGGTWDVVTPDYSGNEYQFQVSTSLGAGGCQGQTGFEQTDSAGNTSASGTSDDNDLVWESKTNAKAWYDTEYYIDYPCGQQGNSPPRCLNGTYYSKHGNMADTWAANHAS
jgi:hypothetical protein